MMQLSASIQSSWMRFALLGCICAGILALGGCRAETKQAPSPPPITEVAGDALSFEGTLVDGRCFPLDKRNAAVDHYRPEGFIKACAQACAMQGFPVAVLRNGDPDGQIWVLMTVPALLADYMSETVRVSGTVRSAGLLIPDRIETKKEGEWIIVL